MNNIRRINTILVNNICIMYTMQCDMIRVNVRSKCRRRLHTQTLNLTFLKVTVSTLKPTVGIVFKPCPSLSLYRIPTQHQTSSRQRDTKAEERG
jgi:hypothetical protein